MILTVVLIFIYLDDCLIRKLFRCLFVYFVVFFIILFILFYYLSNHLIIYSFLSFLSY